MSKPKNAVAILIFFIVLLTIYSNSFDCAWHLDDFHNITNNPNIHLESLDWHEIKKSFSGIRENGINRPLSFFTFALNYYFHQDKVLGYHVVNLFIHFLTTIFLFLTIRQAIIAANTCQFNKSNNFQIALLASLIWAIHPIQLTAITYIVQRMASLAGLFSIICLYFYLLGRAKKSAKKTTCFSLSLIAAFLAFASKENTIILPLIILAAELIIIQEFTIKTLKANYRLSILSGFAVLQFLIMQDFDNLLAGYNSRPFTIEERILTQPRVIFKYLGMLFLPIDQNFALLHDVDYSKSLLQPITTIISAVALLAIFILALLKAHKFPLIAFGFIFFLLNHVVESSIIPLEMIFEHRNYLPSMFIFVLPAIILVRTYQCLSDSKVIKCIYLLLISIIFLLVSHTTYARNQTFKNELSLWLDNNNKYPNLIRTYIALGNAYYMNNDLPKAIGITKIGLDKVDYFGEKKHAAKLLHNLGIQFWTFKQPNYGAAFLLEAVKVDPKNAESYLMLAKIKSDLKEYDQALAFIEKAISSDQKDARYHYAHSIFLTKVGRGTEAITAANHALSLNGQNKNPIFIKGEAYRLDKKLEQAATCYREYLSFFPENTEARIALIEIYHLQGKYSTRDIIYKEITKLLRKRTLDSVIQNFNTNFNLLPKKREDKVREAINEAIKSTGIKSSLPKSKWQ